jgi:hypothetical protein
MAEPGRSERHHWPNHLRKRPAQGGAQAGNVKEWCSNAVGGKRYILGGSWRDPAYL